MTTRSLIAPALVVEGLRKEFPAHSRGGKALVAVDDVSFTLERGGSLAVVGESGSGKTTTARIVAGLERATSGTVTAAGSEKGTARPPPCRWSSRILSPPSIPASASAPV
ncbi:ABC-type oligopeptide transport system ATPase subunit [Streptomyces sp. SAI-119]|nr:ABC-type oligopeptide transport system ATPase subunit [Streptomyces sp. SAI-119]